MEQETRNDVQKLMGEIRQILEPVAQGIGDQAVRREILLALGLDPAGAAQPLAIPPSSLASIDAYRARSADDADLQALISILQDFTQIVQALIDFVGAVAATDADAPPGFAAEEAVSFFLSSITLSYIRVRQPGVYIAAKVLQLIEQQSLSSGGIIDLAFKTGAYFDSLWGSAKALQTEADAQTVSDAALFVAGAFAASFLKGEFVYGYDPGPVSTSPLGDAAADRTLTLRLSGTTKDAANNTVKGALLLSAVLVPKDHGGKGLLVRGQGDAALDVPLTDTLTLKIAAEGPDFLIYMGDGAHDFPTSTEASVTFGLEAKSTAKETIIWFDPKGIHIRIGKMGLTGKMTPTDYGFELQVKDSAFVLATDDADDFLATVLKPIAPSGKLETTFEFTLGYSRQKNWYFGGGAGLLMSIPLHKTLGPMQFNTLIAGIALGERAGKEPGVKLEASLSFGLDLGVLQASVDRIGLSGMVAFEDGDVTFGFKPPNGVGLAINAGAVRGGGFLSFDYDRGEYAGGLELDISGIITVKALGLITTKMPDGSRGFALLIIITAEFGTPIQLGLGFTLIGIGGLLGLNRTMRLDLLAEGIRTGSVDRILFPTNIVANAARIVSDLRTFFPPQNGTFLIGPMLKLGWGTPTLVSLALGVVIQIPPGNVAILGVLRVILPDERAALLKLQVAFIGALEVDKQRAWFFATLFDSRVLYMTLEGGMGVLVAWGANANLVISVGGFHPGFKPPPLPFPTPARVAINILNTPLARIRVMAYFAVTSNTVQFGARAELFLGFDEVSIEGHLAFDALFQFSPFYFIIQISASVSFKVFGIGVFSVRLRGSLEGPTPWRITGAASVSFFFFDVSVDFEKSWGEGADTTLPAASVLPLLAAEFGKESNWTAELPATGKLLVSLRQLDAAADGLVLHPIGQLRISQRAVPLQITIAKVGNQQAADANKFRIGVTGGSLERRSDAIERFAIAQYQEVEPTAKLSLPAFQPEIGGVVIAAAGEQIRSSRMVKRRARYELIIIDSNFKRFARPFFNLWQIIFVHFVGGSAVTKSTLSNKWQSELQPFEEKIVVTDTVYTVAKVQDNTPWAAATQAFGSEAQAREYMSEAIAANPGLASEMHVIPQYEVNGVA